MSNEQSINEIKQLVFLLIKTQAIDTRRLTYKQKQFVDKTLSSWGNEWRQNNEDHN